MVASSSSDTRTGFDPSASATHRLFTPERSDTKAKRVPSGDQTGCISNAVPRRIGRASPPDAATA
ncbi:hypothetical protein [Sphingomonas hankookensis]|uniref:hypothetical protein n=1 Tax=Sphingomonas hankookensis TaxID=563996 RepID=UPI003F7AB1E6